MSTNKNPKISIVIPNYNGGKYLEETILSVINQGYPNVELIVVDGGSTDNSVDIIRKYEKHISYWLSEPDTGQAHAINKGLRFATGDLFDWMNSDDIIAPGTFWQVAKAFEQNPDVYAVCGYMTYFSEGKYQKPVRMSIFDSLEKTMVFGSMSVPSMYFRLDNFREVGLLEENLHYCFDMDFLYRFIEKFGLEKLLLLEGNFCYFRLHPESKTVSQLIKFGEEQYLIHSSVVQSFSNKDLPNIPKNDLGTLGEYKRQWNFKNISATKYTAYSIQRQLELLNSRLYLFEIIYWYWVSFKLSPKNRCWHFYILPIRAIRWKLINKIKWMKY